MLAGLVRRVACGCRVLQEQVGEPEEEGTRGLRGCGCGAGGWRPDWWVVRGLRGLWLRFRWSWSPDWRVARGLQGLVGLRGDAPSEARGVDGERAGRPRAARRSGGVRCAEVWRWCAERSSLCEGSGRRSVAHRRIEQPQKARRVLASCGGLAAGGRAGGQASRRTEIWRGARSCSRDWLLRGPVLLSSHPQLVLL